METVRITTSQNIDIDYEVAGLGERIGAAMIDLGLFIAVLIFAVLIASAFARPGIAEVGLIMIAVVYVILFVFYDLLCEVFMNGQSIGKRILKIKVISLNGARPTIGQYLLRWLFRLVDMTFTSYLGAIIAIAVSEKHQRIGDIVASTTLIKTQPRAKIDHLNLSTEPDTYEPVYPQAAQLNEKDIALIQDVINTYITTQNSMIVYNMALRIRQHLGVTQAPDMNDMKFLQTIIKDYNHVVSGQEGTL